MPGLFQLLFSLVAGLIVADIYTYIKRRVLCVGL
jgi:xanthosine utilization system XapX-like protein